MSEYERLVKEEKDYQAIIEKHHAEAMSAGKNILERAMVKMGQHPGLSPKDAIEMVRMEDPEIFKTYLGHVGSEDLAKVYKAGK